VRHAPSAPEHAAFPRPTQSGFFRRIGPPPKLLPSPRGHWIADGKIAETREVWVALGLMQQIGAIG
jgi:hypothetical protein